MSEKISDLKPFSLGIVVETKPRGTDYILVSPIEELNIQKSGKIKEYEKEFKGDQQDLESKSFKTEHETKHYIRAKWLPYGESNRTTAPDVVASETVMIYKFGDVDEYYWFDIMREPELRRLEDVLYSYSNLKSGLNSFDKDTSYWIRYNTKDKYIHLHTSKNDGEPFVYDITIDAKKGVITAKDDVGNFITFDSSQDTLTAHFNKDINLIAGNDINFTASNNINSVAGNHITKTAGVDISESAGRTIAEQAPNNHMSCGSRYAETEGHSIDRVIGTRLSETIGSITDIVQGPRTIEVSELYSTKAGVETKFISSALTVTAGSISNTSNASTDNNSATITNTASGTITNTVGASITNTVGSSITNDTPVINNTGDMNTAGYSNANPNKNPEWNSAWGPLE